MPRSPGRDLADRYDGNRDYFRRPTRLERGKRALAGLALVGGLAWVGVVVFGGPARNEAFTHGPLAAAHGRLDADCAACHESFTPDWRVLHADERWLSLTCGNCHKDTPAHYKGQEWKVSGHDGCAACHKDHQGRDHSLTRAASVGCADCHAKAEKVPSRGLVADFAGHPPFKVEGAEHARGLKFSHAVHLSAGITRPGSDYRFTVADLVSLSADSASRLQPGKAPTDAVQLDCASCHEPDGRATTAAYFKPVTYDRHCKACHPTTVPATAAGGVALPAVPVPHKKPTASLESLLKGTYAGMLLAKDDRVKALRDPGAERFDPRPMPEAKAFADTLAGVVGKGMASLLPAAGAEGCKKCHDFTDGRKVVPIMTPAVWLPAGRFSHAAHRAYKCQDCHPPTVAGEPLVEKEKLNIPGVKSCQVCHNPAGARDGCATCHRYHNAP